MRDAAYKVTRDCGDKSVGPRVAHGTLSLRAKSIRRHSMFQRRFWLDCAASCRVCLLPPTCNPEWRCASHIRSKSVRSTRAQHLAGVLSRALVKCRKQRVHYPAQASSLKSWQTSLQRPCVSRHPWAVRPCTQTAYRASSSPSRTACCFPSSSRVSSRQASAAFSWWGRPSTSSNA